MTSWRASRCRSACRSATAEWTRTRRRRRRGRTGSRRRRRRRIISSPRTCRGSVIRGGAPDSRRARGSTARRGPSPAGRREAPAGPARPCRRAWRPCSVSTRSAVTIARRASSRVVLSSRHELGVDAAQKLVRVLQRLAEGGEVLRELLADRLERHVVDLREDAGELGLEIRDRARDHGELQRILGPVELHLRRIREIVERDEELPGEKVAASSAVARSPRSSTMRRTNWRRASALPSAEDLARRPVARRTSARRDARERT